MVSSVCGGTGGNQVRSTKTSVSCLQSSMLVGVSWSGAAWVLPALGSYSKLREPWMPTCTVTYWSRAWSPPFGDWVAGQYSNMIMTPNTSKTTTALLKKLMVKVICGAFSNRRWSSTRSLTSARSCKVRQLLNKFSIASVFKQLYRRQQCHYSAQVSSIWIQLYG